MHEAVMMIIVGRKMFLVRACVLELELVLHILRRGWKGTLGEAVHMIGPAAGVASSLISCAGRRA
jgi:hypothetical protein